MSLPPCVFEIESYSANVLCNRNDYSPGRIPFSIQHHGGTDALQVPCCVACTGAVYYMQEANKND